MKIILVTGGARSGKSSFVLRETSKIMGKKAFIATAEALDGEMKDRISRHRVERGEEWNTYEEPIRIASVISDVIRRHRVVVLDCLTIWLSNLLVRTHMSEGKEQTTEESIQELVDTLSALKGEQHTSGNRVLFMVTNEVGMGIVPENKLARQFRDLAGALNQKVAETADEVYLVTAGIPMKIKG